MAQTAAGVCDSDEPSQATSRAASQTASAEPSGVSGVRRAKRRTASQAPNCRLAIDVAVESEAPAAEDGEGAGPRGRAVSSLLFLFDVRVRILITDDFTTHEREKITHTNTTLLCFDARTAHTSAKQKWSQPLPPRPVAHTTKMVPALGLPAPYSAVSGALSSLTALSNEPWGLRRQGRGAHQKR